MTTATLESMKATTKSQCPHCDKWLKSKPGLTLHLYYSHPEQHGCPICDGGNGVACSWHFS